MNAREWFEKNKCSAEEFSDLESLEKEKEKKNLSVSCVIPTLNEEKTISSVVSKIKDTLVDDYHLVDEIIVVDSGSQDRTQQVAEEAGARFSYSKDILPHYGFVKGKGENLWKSLYAASGDIIAWIDADIENISPKFVYGLLGPLIKDPQIGFTKAFYQRPLRMDSALKSLEGGRVTELLMRPLFNLYFPQLSCFIQPLSGEYAGRRNVLDKIPFFTGYGVEMGMLIDIERKFGLEKMVQVDLDERVHRNRPINELSKMSFEILQAFSEKANALGVFVNLDKINSIYTIIEPKFNGTQKPEYELHTNPIFARQRPPMVTIPEYREKFLSGRNSIYARY